MFEHMNEEEREALETLFKAAELLLGDMVERKQHPTEYEVSVFNAINEIVNYKL